MWAHGMIDALCQPLWWWWSCRREGWSWDNSQPWLWQQNPKQSLDTSGRVYVVQRFYAKTWSFPNPNQVGFEIHTSSQWQGKCCIVVAKGPELSPSQLTCSAVINQTIVTRTTCQIMHRFPTTHRQKCKNRLHSHKKMFNLLNCRYCILYFLKLGNIKEM